MAGWRRPEAGDHRCETQARQEDRLVVQKARAEPSGYRILESLFAPIVQLRPRALPAAAVTVAYHPSMRSASAGADQDLA